MFRFLPLPEGAHVPPAYYGRFHRSSTSRTRQPWTKSQPPWMVADSVGGELLQRNVLHPLVAVLKLSGLRVLWKLCLRIPNDSYFASS